MLIPFLVQPREYLIPTKTITSKPSLQNFSVFFKFREFLQKFAPKTCVVDSFFPEERVGE